MEGRVNYTVVGLFVVILSLVLFAGVFWLSSGNHNKLYHGYVVYVQEDVTGLSIESPVRFNGVKVGYVESMRLDHDDPKLVKLTLRIEPFVPITTATYATLNTQGVTGILYVNLKASTGKAPPLHALPGHNYPIIPSHPSLLMQLNSVLPEVASQIQQLSSNISQVLNQQNRDAFQKTLKNMADVSQTLADNTDTFSDSMALLNNSLKNISAASNQFPVTITKVNNTLTSIDSLSAQMHNTSKSIDTAVNNFSNQVMPSAEQALSNISAVSANANQLAVQLQRDPSMLVRGKQPSQRGPGE